MWADLRLCISAVGGLRTDEGETGEVVKFWLGECFIHYIL